MIDFSSAITIEDVGAWMDGGSVTLVCRNVVGQTFEVFFVQNVSWEVYEGDLLPGRLYLDSELVEQRSLLEGQIIEGLNKATFKKPERLIEEILAVKLAYIKSDVYLTDPAKVAILRLEDRGRK